MKRARPIATTDDNVPMAAAIVTFTVFILSLGDALVKSTSGSFVLWQIFVLRSAIAIPLLLLFMAVFARGSLMIPITPVWVIVRSVLLVLMWVSYYASLPHLTFSVAATAYYTLPIFITVFSALLVGDAITRQGWIAVVVGFLGIVLILRPDASDFNGYALLPLLSAMLYALAMILTRTKCRADPPLLLALCLNMAFVVVGCLAAIVIVFLPTEIRHGFLLAPWTVMETSEWLSMGLLALAILVGSVGAAIAYQRGPSSIIGVFDFSYVGFAVVWGAVFFSEIPDKVTLLGIGLIVGAGIISLRQRAQ